MYVGMLKKDTTSGLLWNGVERVVSKGIQFVFSILIARILLPSDYGIIAIVNLLVSLSDILTDGGLTKALIRKKEKTARDYNTVFYFNILSSCLIYALLLWLAPVVSRYYNEPLLIPVIRFGTLSLLFNSFCSIQNLCLVTEMNFRKMAHLGIVSTTISGILAFILAKNGAGVWALVSQGLVASGLRSLLSWIIVKWRPSRSISMQALRELFSFGIPLLLSEYIVRIYNAFYTFSIGKIFSTTELGYYGKADAFASVPSSLISGPINMVSYPALASIQDEDERMRGNFYNMMGMTAFVIIPIMTGLALVSTVLVPFVLTAKWNPIITYLKLLSLSYIFSSIAVVPQNFIYIKGKSRIVMYVQLISKIAGLVLLFILSRFSLDLVCWGILATSIFNLLLLLIYSRSLISFSWKRLSSLFFPIIIFCTFMSLVVYMILHIVENPFISLSLCVIMGAVTYILPAIFTKNPYWIMLKSLVPWKRN